MQIQTCPKCGKSGSLHTKWVLNPKKKRYFPYYYVAHYDPEKHGVKWCYIPRSVAQALDKSLPNTTS